MEIEQLKSYLPKDKSDFTSVRLLKKLPEEELETISFELLAWLQDINWPIANEIIEVLIPLDNQLVPHLKRIFETNDYEWIDNCLRYLVRKMSKTAIDGLREDLSQLIVIENSQFLEYEIPLVAKEILEKLKLK